MSFSTVTIHPRRSMMWFANLVILMVAASYVFVVVPAGACVYLPYLSGSSTELSTQSVLLFAVRHCHRRRAVLVPLRDRIAAAERLPPASQPEDTHPASSLRDDPPAVELGFLKVLNPNLQLDRFRSGWRSAGAPLEGAKS